MILGKLNSQRLMYAICFFVSCLIAVNAPCQKRQLSTDTIALGPKIIHGALKNGLKYYIVKNVNSEKFTQLILLEKAGNVVENENELGIAHLIEHLSFRRTVDFPNGLTNFMATKGLRLGVNLMGSTTLLTTYQLKIPDGDTSLLNYSFLALKNFAKGRLYLSQDVEEERAIVLNEMRPTLTKSFQALKSEPYLLLDQNPLFQPTSDKEFENISKIQIDEIIKFDKKWYRPDLQCVIIVGNIDPSTIQLKIGSIFSDLKVDIANSVPNITYEKYAVSLNGTNKLVILDNESDEKRIRVRMLKKRKAINGTEGPVTIGQKRTEFLDRIYNELISRRFAILREDNSRVIHTVNRRAIHKLAGIDALETYFEVDSVQKIRKTLMFAMKELKRIQQWGFTKQEFDEVRKAIKHQIENENNVQGADSIVEGLVKHYSSMSAFADNNLNTIIDGITLIELNEFARTWLSENKNQDIMFIVPDSNDPNLPQQKEVFSWINIALQENMSQYVPAKIKDLPTVKRYSGKKINSSQLNSIKATKLVLPNGAQIIIKRLGAIIDKPFASSADLWFKGIRNGGTNLYNDKEYPSAAIAGELVLNSAFSTLSKQELEDWISRRNESGYIDASPYIKEVESGIVGQSSVNNIDHLFHLVNLYFTQPGADSRAFDWLLKMKNSNLKRNKSAIELFTDTISAFVNHQSTKETSEPPQLNESFRIYKERFNKISDFTFIVVGYFEEDEIIKQIVTYLGGIHSKSKKSIVKRNFPDSMINEKQSAPPMRNLNVSMIGDSTGDIYVRMLFPCATISIEQEYIKLLVLQDLLKQNLVGRLRETEKAVYWPFLNLLKSKTTNEQFLELTFEVSPNDINRTISAALDEVENLNDRITDEALDGSRKNIRDMLEKEIGRPAFWIEHFSSELRMNHELTDPFEKVNILNKITLAEIRNASKTFISTKTCSIFKLL